MYSTFYKKAVMVLALFTCHLSLFASATSVAGLFPIANSGRVVYNFNEGWHFLLGDAAGAEAVDFDFVVFVFPAFELHEFGDLCDGVVVEEDEVLSADGCGAEEGAHFGFVACVEVAFAGEVEVGVAVEG